VARRDIICGGAALAVVALAGTAHAAAAQAYVVTMTNMSYGAIPAVKVGDTITWVNHDTVQHTVTARDKSFDLRINPGRSASMTVQKAGTFPIMCMMHPTMRGMLKVAAQ
jgi:plastocyanin